MPRRKRWHGGVEDKPNGNAANTESQNGCMSDAVDNAASDIDDYDGNNKKHDDDHKYADDNGEANYEDDDDNSAKYDVDDCNVRIVP